MQEHGNEQKGIVEVTRYGAVSPRDAVGAYSFDDICCCYWRAGENCEEGGEAEVEALG